MVTTMTSEKRAYPVDNFSPKYHLNLPYIDKDIVNGVDGMNIEVLGGCVYETIVQLRNKIQAEEIWFQ